VAPPAHAVVAKLAGWIESPLSKLSVIAIADEKVREAERQAAAIAAAEAAAAEAAAAEAARAAAEAAGVPCEDVEMAEGGAEGEKKKKKKKRKKQRWEISEEDWGGSGSDDEESSEEEEKPVVNPEDESMERGLLADLERDIEGTRAYAGNTEKNALSITGRYPSLLHVAEALQGHVRELYECVIALRSLSAFVRCAADACNVKGQLSA
jgi:hypothetical protein